MTNYFRLKITLFSFLLFGFVFLFNSPSTYAVGEDCSGGQPTCCTAPAIMELSGGCATGKYWVGPEVGGECLTPAEITADYNVNLPCANSFNCLDVGCTAAPPGPPACTGGKVNTKDGCYEPLRVLRKNATSAIIKLFRSDFIGNIVYLPENTTCGVNQVIGWDGSKYVCAKGGLWSESGTVTDAIYYDKGKVGIGTSSPVRDLHVLGTGYFNETLTLGDNFTNSGTLTFLPGDGLPWFHIDNGPKGARSQGLLRFSVGGSPGASTIMTLAQNKRVGIGTNSPSEELHVEGTGFFRSETNAAVIAQSTQGVGMMVSGSDRGMEVTSPFGTGIQVSGSDIGVKASGSDIGVRGAGSFGGYFEGKGYFSGNVGIGDSSPDYPLDVKGSINIESTSTYLSYWGFWFKNPALYVDGKEAIKLDGTTFHWGNGGSTNFFTDKVEIGTTSSTSIAMLKVSGKSHFTDTIGVGGFLSGTSHKLYVKGSSYFDGGIASSGHIGASSISTGTGNIQGGAISGKSLSSQTGITAHSGTVQAASGSFTNTLVVKGDLGKDKYVTIPSLHSGKQCLLMFTGGILTGWGSYCQP